jgi:hypothetical protein
MYSDRCACASFSFLFLGRGRGTYLLVVCLDFFYALGQVFSIFEDLGISVDCVATSEVSISLTLDPSKLWSRELIQQVSI